MSADLIPVIYALRAKVNEARSIDEQTDAIVQTMLSLERVFGAYDSMDFVNKMKSMLGEHFFQDQTEINIRNHLQMKGFEPIKLAIINALVLPTGKQVVIILSTSTICRSLKVYQVF